MTISDRSVGTSKKRYTPDSPQSKSVDLASSPIIRIRISFCASKKPLHTFFTGRKEKESFKTHTRIRLTIRQEWISALIHIDLSSARIRTALARIDWRLSHRYDGLAVVPRCVGGACIDDLDGDFFAGGFVGDGVAFGAGGARAERRFVGVVRGELVGDALL